MPDLADGESVEIQGSGAKPYVLKNVGGVYSCTCPAWRNQSIGIERRTCKHLRKYRGDAAEEARLGGTLPARSVKKAAAGDDAENAAAAPPLLLAESWDNALDLSGWWMSEKLDGVRAFWDGRQFLSRQGNLYHAPDWFVEGLPNVPLDGELWIDRKAFQRTVSIVRRQDKSDHWTTVRYLVFDAPAVTGPFEERIDFLKDGVRAWRNSFVTIHEHSLCRDVSHLRDELQRIEALGGEGLMLRQPGSKYASGRSATLLKVKTFHDAEAEVIRHEPGKGRHKGRLGALTVRLPNGKEFSVGTGFSDKQRENPPALGSLIQFRYQELSDAGIPRFPSYVGLRSDITASDGVARPESSKGVVSSQLAQRPRPSKTQGVPPAASVVKPTAAKSPSTRTTRGQAPQNSELAECSPDSAWRSIPPILNSAVPDPGPPVSSAPRRFEFIEGSSSKFWEVSIDGSDVTTRWGRIGTDGQSKTKSFATPDKAQAEYDKLVDEKVGKGYKEIASSGTDRGSDEVDEFDDADSEQADSSTRPVPVQQVDEPQEAATAEDEDVDEPSRTAEIEQIRARIRELAQTMAEIEFDNEPDLEDDDPERKSELPGVPAEIHLETSDKGVFTKTGEVSRLSEEIRDASFTVIGDFTIRELPVVMRAFFRQPNVVAVVFELGQFLWVELTVSNADGTREVWSNVPMHDGLVPPWSTLVRNPDGDFRQLHEMMAAGHAGKEPARMSAEEFAQEFEEAYSRAFQWRTSLRTDPVSCEPVSQEIEDKVRDFSEEYRKAPGGYRTDGPLEAVPAGAKLMQLDPVSQIEVLRACFQSRDPRGVRKLRERMLKKKLPYAESDIEFLASELKQSADDEWERKPILGAIERYAKDHPLTAKTRELLRGARDRAHLSMMSSSDNAKVKARIDALVGDDAVRMPIQPNEAWADAAIAAVTQMPPDQRAAWTKLLQHCVRATSGTPTAAWRKDAETLITVVDRREFLQRCQLWFALFDKPRTGPAAGYNQDPLAVVDSNQDVLRGLVACCGLGGDDQTARTLGTMAISAFRKIPRIGPRAVRVGNACVVALSALSDSGGVAQLAILKVKVKSIPAQKLIEKELDAAATRMGLPREELEEMSVPAYGLDDIGVRRESIGDYTAELVVAASGSTELRWIKSDGSPQKSVPAAVQKEFGEELKEFKAAAKDIQKMVPVQRERIDGLFLQQKSWPLAAWRERYLDHPLVGIIARRLIWRFRTGQTTAVGIFHDGQIMGCDDVPIRELGEQTTVELWHPIGQPLDEIMAWRARLEQHEVQQPFKQAHREVYLLTDAERATGIYSNRFAAHVLRQTRLRALASMRGWHCALLGEWDSGGETAVTRHLSRWGLSAQFWINAIYGGTPADDDDFGGAPGSPGVPYISTDQVRFYSEANQQEPIPLADVPPLVFSEILRDVDLFVGVASVGNDPTWADGGPGGHHLDYWQTYSFGDLSASAHTRHDVLERLVPRLKIADRCSLTDRFLVVRGDIRTYKIHLGSGNILMSPNDQYLCIVPKQAAAAGDKARVFLPFEGDNTLSVILSKAFLLAEDTKIKDATITSQIRRG